MKRALITVVLPVLVFVTGQRVQADIFRRDNGELIPGTGRGSRQSREAILRRLDLSAADLAGANLTRANLGQITFILAPTCPVPISPVC